MRWVHDKAGDRCVRLAYCMNVHAAEDLESIRAGIERVTLPLRDRLSGGAPFGVGMYLAGDLARRLSPAESGAGAARGVGDELAGLARFLHAEDLDPFTFNAFPFGGFHESGLKHDVYRPTWLEGERLEFTRAVARCAAALQRPARAGEDPALRHVSISTHAGGFGTWIRTGDDFMGCASAMARLVEDLVRLEAGGGPRIVLSVEAEPRSSANDSRELFAFLAFVRAESARAFLDAGVDPARAHALPARHVGTCLDCCHSAVEFEDPVDALSLATGGGPLGKLQFSSALSLDGPAASAAGRECLLAMDEPRYLHQVTGRPAPGEVEGAPLLAVDDLEDLARALADPAGSAAWLASPTWRCHFHVPVDLTEFDGGLTTTRAHADRLLDLALADPAAWTTDELHVEIETYTWDVLEGSARGSGDLVDGLEREYRHVMARLESAGWKRAPLP